MANNGAMRPNALPAINEGLSKKQITTLVKQSVENVLENGNVAQVAEVLAVMEEFVKGIRKDERFVDLMRDELLKHHGMLKTTSGARIEACEAAISYDYSDNPSWHHLNNQITELTAEKKNLEEK